MGAKYDPILGRLREKDAGSGGGGGDVAISDVTGLQTALNNCVNVNQLGVAGGVPTLNSEGKIPQSQVDYACQKSITTIPAATATYNLADGGVYQHTPDEPPTYNLPAVSDATTVHEIELSVKFTASALSCVFKSSGGNVIVPRTTPPIVAGSVVSYKCRYEPLLSQWVVVPDQPGGRNVPPNNRIWYSAAAKPALYSGYGGDAVNVFEDGYGELIKGNTITSISNALRGTAVTSVSLPDSITSIDQSACNGCANLVSIRLPDGLSSIGVSAFKSCSSLTISQLPSGVTNIGTDAFNGCSVLALTSIPSGVTVLRQASFANCPYLVLTSLPTGLTTVEKTVFKGCVSLAITEIPSGVNTIGNEAFGGCTGLTSMTFLGTPTTISATAFKDCTNLTEIKVPWDENDEINANAPWGATNAVITYNYTGE